MYCWECKYRYEDHGGGYCIHPDYNDWTPIPKCEKSKISEAIWCLKRLQEPYSWEPQITKNTYNLLEYAIKVLEEQNEKIPNP